jgi:hypothetical protein
VEGPETFTGRRYGEPEMEGERDERGKRGNELEGRRSASLVASSSSSNLRLAIFNSNFSSCLLYRTTVAPTACQ